MLAVIGVPPFAVDGCSVTEATPLTAVIAPLTSYQALAAGDLRDAPRLALRSVRRGDADPVTFEVRGDARAIEREDRAIHTDHVSAAETGELGPLGGEAAGIERNIAVRRRRTFHVERSRAAGLGRPPAPPPADPESAPPPLPCGR